MSSTRDELMEAVIAAPDDDAPRLVLADWFAERGDARGELIHVGLALGRGGLDQTQHEACSRRYHELIQGAGTAWLRELGLKQDEVGFERGMVERVSLPWPRFLKAAEGLFARAPLRHLTTRSFGSDLRKWGTHPWLGRLSALELSGVNEKELQVVLEAKTLQLRALAIEGWQSQARPCAQLAQWSGVGQLRSLTLRGLAVTDLAIDGLVPHLGSLDELDLSMNSLGMEGLRAIAPRLSDARALWLGSNIGLGDAAAAFIAAAGFTKLQLLNLERTRLGRPGAEHLLRPSELPALRWLDLSSNELTDADASALAQVPDPGLWSLNVSGTLIGGAGEQALRERYGARVRI